MQDEEENSFDPSEFFRHSALADQVTDQVTDQVAEGEEQQAPAVAADINNDLQVSESESDEDEIDRNFDPLAGITSQEQNDDGGFDIDSFYS